MGNIIAKGLACFLGLAMIASCSSKKKVTENIPLTLQQTPQTKEVAPTGPVSWRVPTDSVRHEMRAVWLTTVFGLDWPTAKADTPDGVRRQKEELNRILDRLVADGYNTVFYQARQSGSVTYFGSREPFSRVFTSDGSRPSYDPLAYVVEACHKRGLAVHAWLVTYPLVSSRRSPHPIVETTPSWAIVHRGTRHLDPGNPEVRRYIAELSADIARRYDVDGLHYDYFRYPEEAERFNDRRSFEHYGAGLSLEDWRRSNLTKQLSEIREAVAKVKPEMQISVAPLGKLRQLPTLGRKHGWTAYESVFQDVETWAKRGLVDFVAPMMYYKDDLYEPFLIDWQRAVGRYIPVVAGLAPYRVVTNEAGTPWDASVIGEQIEIARRHRAGGVAMFRLAHVAPQYPRLRTLIQRAFAAPAVLPVLPRGKAEGLRPAVPRDLRVAVQGKLLRLSWLMPEDTPSNITYRVWTTVIYPDGRREHELLIQGLKQRSCAMRLADFSEASQLELGVEAVNSYGVATPCQRSLTLDLEKQRRLATVPENTGR